MGFFSFGRVNFISSNSVGVKFAKPSEIFLCGESASPPFTVRNTIIATIVTIWGRFE